MGTEANLASIKASGLANMQIGTVEDKLASKLDFQRLELAKAIHAVSDAVATVQKSIEKSNLNLKKVVDDLKFQIESESTRITAEVDKQVNLVQKEEKELGTS